MEILSILLQKLHFSAANQSDLTEIEYKALPIAIEIRPEVKLR